MNRPTNIKIIKQRKCDFFRLQYKRKEFTVTSVGFKNKEEFLRVLKDDEHFKIDINTSIPKKENEKK